MQKQTQSLDLSQNYALIYKKIKQIFSSKVRVIDIKKLASLSNDVYKVTIQFEQPTAQLGQQSNEKEVKLIYKIYKHQLAQFINRDAQQIVLQQLSKEHAYPKIYLINKQERVQQFIQGQELTVQTATPQLLFKIVKNLAHFSKRFTPIFQKQQNSRSIQNLWFKFHEIYQQMKKRQPQQVQKCRQCIQRVLNPQLLQALIKFLPKQMILSHNDSNLTNILLKNQEEVQLLDFQFIGMNYIGFDIGNFLNQYATQYHDGFQIRDEWQLEQNLKQKLVKAYFEQLGFQAKSQMKIVHFGRLLSHLFWMFVGLKQIGDDNGLDMVYYIRKRFQQLQKGIKVLTHIQI